MRRSGLIAGTLVLSALVVLTPFTLASGPMQMPMAQAVATDQLPPNPGCSPAVVPVGQANPPGTQLEPLDPIWCFNLAPAGQPGRVTGANDWIDTFDSVPQMGQFNDGDYGYRIFPAQDACATFKTQHFTNNQHWMDDNVGSSTCGVMMRPNRAFQFENGKLVVEQDIAAGITGYSAPPGGGVTWPEIDISMAPNPTSVNDNLYGYGQFAGNWSFGCRINALRNPICALEEPTTGAPNTDAFPCQPVSPSRVLEIADVETCGSTHIGGDPGGDNGQYWRTCNSAAQSPDMMCRDRFRIELTATSLTLYVNGHLYFQDANWPAGHQIDPAAIASGQWYVYATDWQGGTSANTAFRYHWDRFAVNPHNPDGSPMAPSAVPNFCLGQPGNVCMSSMATNTPVANTPLPTNTAVPPTGTPVSSPTAVVDTCAVLALANGQQQTYTRPLSFCTNQ